MKTRIYFFFLCIFFSSASAKIYTIQFGGTFGYSYQPNALNALVGDTIQWVGKFSDYPLQSTSVPYPAFSFGPVSIGDTFIYIIRIPGDYAYQCPKYATIFGMRGNFSSTRTLFGLGNDGREFYIGALAPSYNSVANGEVLADFKVDMLISSYYATDILISYYDPSGIELQPVPYRIQKEEAIEVQLNYGAMLMDGSSDLPAYKACHVTSKYPITVYYKSMGACAGGSYLALPVLSLGKNYVAASYNDNPGAGALYGGNGTGWKPSTFDYAGGKFMVIATEDVTSVKITPAGSTVSGHVAKIPYTIQLNKGQCYLAKSDGKNEDNDMSGSLIEASKPIVVISGHENADLGGTDPFTMEARDFMIEEMVPVEYWDTSGFISVPLYEGVPPGTEGSGDGYRIYTFDTSINKVHLDAQGISGGYDYSTIRLAPPPGKYEVNGPAEAYSINGKKIAVMQYDERSVPANPPWPSPSMVTIVPVSRWKRNYSFSVSPTNGADITYVNVIALDLKKIVLAKNGIAGALTSLSLTGNFNNISGHYPGMQAGQYKFPPSQVYASSYVLTSPDPFMVYFYGFHDFSPMGSFLGDLKNYSSANWISEFASPSGIQLYTGVYPSFTVDTQSTCTGWHICIRDTGNTDPGIKAAILIDDPDGIYWQTPAKFSNVSFDATSNDYAEGELHPHWHTNSAYCFDVNFASPLAAASAPLAIVDNLGNAIILRLDRTAPTVKLVTSPATSTRADSIVFPVKQIGTQICTTFVLKNTAPKNGTAINLNSVQLSNGDTSYKANTSNITFPHSIAAGDSVSFQVCYTPIDSSRHQDTLILKSDCFSIPISLDAHGSTGLISAGDLDFKTVYIGDTSCKVFQIKNVGSAPFTLTASYLNSDTLNFTVDASKLPAIINPGGYANISICFHRQAVQAYSDSVIWNTDLESAFKHSLKDHSFLSGEGIQKAGVASSKENSFTIRPNPANGNYVIVTFDGWTEVHPTMVVFDVLGREVYKREIASGASQVQIPIQNLTEGTYYVRLNSENGSITQSFMKVK